MLPGCQAEEMQLQASEIAPYAVGQPELRIRLDELEGIAKPRYLGRE